MVTSASSEKQAGPTGRGVYRFESLPLQRGGQFGPIALAYETWGTLNAEGDNAVLIAHALTGGPHAHDAEYPDDPKLAWWNPLIGPGRPFDTSRYFVICSNVLGGCYGSTGPSSLDPATGRPYGTRFPVITIREMVNAQRLLKERLRLRVIALFQFTHSQIAQIIRLLHPIA